jgi:hypothetical protein
LARAPGQEWCVGLIAAASGERWDGGYPAGLDWDEPVLSAWLTRRDGGCRSVVLVLQDEREAALESQLIMRPRSERLAT